MEITDWFALDLKAIVVALLVYWICSSLYNRYRIFKTFKTLGIDGPPPSILFSNMKDINFGNPECLTVMQSWIEKYGRVFGFFRGIKPIVCVTDQDILKSVLIKDFHKFVDRPHVIIPAPGVLSKMLTHLRGAHWKQVRTVVTPTFSGKKMREMAPLIASSVDIFVDEVGKKVASEEEFDIYASFQSLTLQVIGECAFALDVNCQRNPHDLFLVNVKAFFNNFNTKLFTFFVMFPEIGKLLNVLLLEMIKLKGVKPRVWLERQLKKVIELRKNSKINHIDLLQLLLNARKENEMSNKDNSLDKTKVYSSITQEDVEGQVFVILLAGYETTANTLGFTCHLLAKHPDVQVKVQEEIDKFYGTNSEPNFDNVQQLQYMEQVIFEALRVLPPVTFFISRECLEDHLIKGITIPKGASVMIPTYNLHHDPEFWNNPEIFSPDRFSTENTNDIPQMAYLPFGAGPRNCIGMRFALMEIKITIAKLLRKYTLVPGKNFESEPELRHFNIFLSPKNGVHVKAVPRTRN